MSEESRYVVSARKFRPQTFKDVFGQEHVTQTLKNAIISKRLSHASLFCGPSGVGKTTCARIFAKAINCENLAEDGEPCNHCTPCEGFNKNSSMNIFELDAASNNSVEDIRNLNDQVQIGPMYGQYKVYIIDEVHMLSSGAFNAFLKTLEEPPHYAFFILATTEKQKILPTILSRCQIFDFKRISDNDIAKQMSQICEEEKYFYDNEALKIIAEKAEGSMRDALSLMDSLAGLTNYSLTYDIIAKQFNLLDNTFFLSFFETLLAQDFLSLLKIIREQYQHGQEVENIIQSLCRFLRDILLCKISNKNALLNDDNKKILFKTLSPNMSKEWVVNALHILNDTYFEIRHINDKMLFFESRLSKLLYLKNAIEFASSDLEQQKKKLHKPESVVITKDIISINKKEKKNIYKVPSSDKIKEPENTYSSSSNSTSVVQEKEEPIPELEKPKDKTTTPVKNKESFTNFFHQKEKEGLDSIALEDKNFQDLDKQLQEELKDHLLEFWQLAKKEVLNEKNLKSSLNQVMKKSTCSII